MDFQFTPEQEAFRAEVRAFIREKTPPALLERIRGESDSEASASSKEFRHLLAQKGWLGISWPKEYGGMGKPGIFQYILVEELGYYGLPAAGLSLTSVGPTIWRVGTEEQKREYLGGIVRGEIDFALGYSEPSAGTDLASLETSAVHDGDEYVINGQKIFTSSAHISSHIWLAARTDPTAPRARGISMIIVPLNTPGITVRPLWTMADGRTNETFFDNVRVPLRNCVGEENRGFYNAAMALDYERAAISPVSPMQRTLDDLVEFCKTEKRNGIPLAEDPIVSQQLATLAVDVGILRLFVYRNAWMMQERMTMSKEASVAKVWSSELRVRLASAALEIMGPFGQLKQGSGWVPMSGRWERLYRQSPMLRFGGGANEVQRNIIAQRGLGLPR